MKRIVIVGATSGIGRGLAERMVARGERVAVLGRREEALCEMAALYPDNIVTCRCDVRQTEQIEPSLEKVREALRGIDLLVLSAGTGHLNPALDYGLEADTLATNVTGWTRVADWAMRCFLDQGHGHLVALTSIGGLRGCGMAPAYNASKAYQINYLEGLRKKARCSGRPIVVTDICPGFVDTAMAKGDGLFWVMPLERVVSQIDVAILKRKTCLVVTRRWRLVACLLRWLPSAIYDRIGE